MGNGLFAGGDGSASSPYLIEDVHDLNAVKKELDKHYKLINDIDLNVAPYNEGSGWVGIDKFSGVLDGNGYIIDNLYINRNASFNQGLFQEIISPAIIKNLGLDNVNINIGKSSTSGASVGALFARTSRVDNDIKISNIFVKLKYMKADLFYVGGLAGTVTTGGSIENCYVVGEIEVPTIGSAFGGFIGRADRTTPALIIKDCYSNVRMTNRGTGFIGSSFNTNIGNLYNKDLTRDGNGATGLTTQEMQIAQTFIDAGWLDELNDDGSPIWILQDGEYPKLWYEIVKLSLVQENGVYYIYEDNEFVAIDPTLENFEKYGEDLLVTMLSTNDKIKMLMSEKGNLGEGKEFSLSINMEDVKNKYGDIKKIKEI